jgi:energy-coupling factor transporter ATP-binding protein EcfA2
MTVKITSLHAENVKRVKAVALEPSPTGLTVIGGKNGQGKTSVLDAVAWVLGGEKRKPSEPRRDGSVLPPEIRVQLSNGIVVERKGKNSALHVIDPSGNRAGQKLLDAFVEQFALDLPRFMAQSPKDKTKTLLAVVGVGARLSELEAEEAKLYSRRTEIGRIAEQKRHAADEMEMYPDAPDEIVSALELIQRQQDILARNADRQRLVSEKNKLNDLIMSLDEQIQALEKRLREAKENYRIADRSPNEMKLESTEELERDIADVDETNRKARANLARAKALDEAEQYRAEHEARTAEIEQIRADKLALLSGADLPLRELGVEDGELTYRGYRWDNLSGSEQLKVAVAIVRKLNPECGFVLLDKLEQMDPDTLAEFGAWLEQEDLQAIATRVSTGDECRIIIEDGYAAGQDFNEFIEKGWPTTPARTEGEEISWT